MAKKTRYKFIHFKELSTFWDCRNNRTDGSLGKVYYLETWRQYVFAPVGDCIFSQDCLEDIIDFIKQLDGG